MKTVVSIVIILLFGNEVNCQQQQQGRGGRFGGGFGGFGGGFGGYGNRCPSGGRPQALCSNGNCGNSGLTCSNNIYCCSTTNTFNNCPPGFTYSGRQCQYGGLCAVGSICNSKSRSCCSSGGAITPVPSTCPTGTTYTGQCVNGICPFGSACIGSSCCRAGSVTPAPTTCPTGTTYTGRCVNGICSTGSACIGVSCCRAGSVTPAPTTCPTGMTYSGPCINGACTAGSGCIGNNCCRIGGTTQQCPNNRAPNGNCVNGFLCFTPGYVCNTANNLCCPQ